MMNKLVGFDSAGTGQNTAPQFGSIAVSIQLAFFIFFGLWHQKTARTIEETPESDGWGR